MDILTETLGAKDSTYKNSMIKAVYYIGSITEIDGCYITAGTTMMFSSK
jgi:hypothetical protein